MRTVAAKGVIIGLGLLACLGAGTVLAAAPVPPTAQEIATACHPGKDPEKPGSTYAGGLSRVYGALTPATLDGATTISPAEAYCLLDRFGTRTIVLSAVPGDTQIPDYIDASGAAQVVDDEAGLQKDFGAYLDQVSGGNKTVPILVYCHHESCFLSYNVAIRALRAGYRQVYWLRAGINGWQAAGYPLAVPDAYVESVKECDHYHYDTKPDDFALLAVDGDDAKTTATWASRARDDQSKRKMCLEDVKEDYSRYTLATRDIDARIAASDAEVTRQYADARTTAEGDADTYFGARLGKPDELRAILQTAATVRTLEQTCGTFDFSMPPLDNAVIQARDQARRAYGDCMEAWREADIKLYAYEFEGASERLAGTRRYTCRQRAVARCLSNDKWDRVAAIVTPANLEKVKAASDIVGNRVSVNNAMVDRFEKYLEDVNKMVAAYNANAR